MNVYDERRLNQHNFVAADVAQVTVEPSPIRRADIVESNRQLIEAYSSQQKMLLGRLQDETVGSRSGGFLSDADCLLERRKTSALYLWSYGIVSGLTVGGLAFLAHVAGGVDGVLSLGGWMAGTGALTALLIWKRHGDEFAHSPEGIARHMLDWHGSHAMYESETRRLSLQWEFQSEERRQAAAAQAADNARQLAELRISEIESRRKAVEAQNERRFAVRWQTETAQERPHEAMAECIDDDAETHQDAPSADSAHSGETWRDSLVLWVSQLYADPGALTADGVIRQRVPWAARSAWLDADKQAARRVCCELRPALIVPSDGGRWRLRREMFPDADVALALLAERLTD